MTDRGEPLGDAAKRDIVGRDAPPADRLAWINHELGADQTAHPITAVVVDGYEEGSAIILHRDGARSIVFPGAAAMLNAQRLQAIVGAVLRRTPPLFKREHLSALADAVWSLSTMRNIYDSVDSAADWGRSYLYAAQKTKHVDDPQLSAGENAARRWEVFSGIKQDDELAAAEDTSPPARVAPGGVGTGPRRRGGGLVTPPILRCMDARDAVNAQACACMRVRCDCIPCIYLGVPHPEGAPR